MDQEVRGLLNLWVIVLIANVGILTQVEFGNELVGLDWCKEMAEGSC